MKSSFFFGTTVILIGKPPKPVSFSIHPFFIGFRIHDVLRSWMKKETIPSTKDAGQGDYSTPFIKRLTHHLARSLKTATRCFINVPSHAFPCAIWHIR